MTKLKIESQNIYNKQKIPVIKIAKKIFDYYMSHSKISKNSCLKGYNYKSVSFDFLFCNSEYTHQINKEYRNKDYPADIITFAVFADSKTNERFILDGNINLGEIIIAVDKIKQSAKEKDIPFKTELIFFVSHGIMHLLGFDHQTIEDYNFVIEYQKKALESLNIIYDKI